MKIKLEWIGEKPETWRQAKVDFGYSKKGNCYIKHDGKVYVFKDRRVGTTVLSQVDGKWAEVGRVDISGNIFIGGKDDMSYAEYCRTPEALEASRKFMENWRAGARARGRNV